MEPNREEVIQYFNERLDYYLGKPFKPEHNPRLKNMQTFLDFNGYNGNKILDVGCGLGVLSKYFANRGGIVTAIDVAERLLEYAQEHNNHPNITYLNQDITTYVSDEKFDYLVFCDVLEHLPKEQIFQILQRITEHNAHKGSIVIMEVPNAAFTAAMQKYYPDELQIIDNGYKMDYLISVMDYYGFIPVRIGIFRGDTNVQYDRYEFATKEQMDEYYHTELSKIYGR